MSTYSVEKVDILNPDPLSINIEDIAHALSLQCRYNGHCNKFYSVAEHSILAARMFKARYGIKFECDFIYTLMHDAAEAYVGDLISPVKSELLPFIIIETRFLNTIKDRFGFSWMWYNKKRVKQVDRWMLATEMDQLFDDGVFCEDILSGDDLCGPDIKLKFWKPKKAEKEFLKAFREYYNG